jgi:hypothetical protein
MTFRPDRHGTAAVSQYPRAAILCLLCICGAINQWVTPSTSGELLRNEGEGGGAGWAPARMQGRHFDVIFY